MEEKPEKPKKEEDQWDGNWKSVFSNLKVAQNHLLKVN